MEDNTLNLLSIGQASEYLGVSIDTLRRWEKKGKIASYRSPGGHRYFKKNELDSMFGKKYERSEETKPRKDYETKDKVVSEQVTETVTVIENDDISQQEAVDEIIGQTADVKSEIEDFFSRQPKNISIPKIEPVRVVSQVVTPTSAAMPLTSAFTPTTPVAPAPKLFTSFSQIPDTAKKPAKIKNPLTLQFFMIIIAAIVLLIATIFVVIFFASKPTLISPV